MTVTTVQTLTIAQSEFVSGSIPIGNAKSIALLVPEITSAQLFFPVAQTDAASANFYRAFAVAGDAEFSFDTGPGSNAIVLTDVLAGFGEMKIESSVAQGDDRDLIVVTRK